MFTDLVRALSLVPPGLRRFGHQHSHGLRPFDERRTGSGLHFRRFADGSLISLPAIPPPHNGSMRRRIIFAVEDSMRRREFLKMATVWGGAAALPVGFGFADHGRGRRMMRLRVGRSFSISWDIFRTLGSWSLFELLFSLLYLLHRRRLILPLHLQPHHLHLPLWRRSRFVRFGMALWF